MAVRLIGDALARESLSRGALRTTSGWIDASVGCAVPTWTDVAGVNSKSLNDSFATGRLASHEVHAQVHHLVALHASPDEAPLVRAGRSPFVVFDLHQGSLRFAPGRIGDPPVHLSTLYAKHRRRLGPLADEVVRHLER